jgi:hypothetical protein
MKNEILDNFKVGKDEAIQETVEYRMLLILLWMITSAWAFYEGILKPVVMDDTAGLTVLLLYPIEIVFGHYLIGGLAIGMAFVVFKQFDTRISYLFSFLGVLLIILLVQEISGVIILCFLPLGMLLFTPDLKKCLSYYALSLFLFLVVMKDLVNINDSLLTSPSILFICIPIFMSLYSYRTRLFPLSDVRIELKYRLFLLVGFLPFILGEII